MNEHRENEPSIYSLRIFPSDVHPVSPALFAFHHHDCRNVNTESSLDSAGGGLLQTTQQFSERIILHHMIQAGPCLIYSRMLQSFFPLTRLGCLFCVHTAPLRRLHSSSEESHTKWEHSACLEHSN